MQDQPVVVVMDGWCLREKSKVFLKLFFGDTMWHEEFFSCLQIYAKFKKLMNYRGINVF